MARMKQLTYHHIKEKRNGGAATIENGALLSFENHMWFNQQSPEAQRTMNQAFQEYKKASDHNIRIAIAELTTDGIQQAKLIEFEEPEETIEIPVYDFTEDEYQKYLQERRKRQYKKFEQIDRCK